jgi:hypothetical protein
MGSMEALTLRCDLPPLVQSGNPEVIAHDRWRGIFEDVLGQPVRALYLGPWGSRLLGWWGAAREYLLGRPELTGRDKILHLLAGDWVHDLTGLVKIVPGMRWSGLKEGTRRTHLWYQRRGWYRGSRSSCWG